MGMWVLDLGGGKGSETTGDKEQAILSSGQPLDSGGGGSWSCLAAGELWGVEFEGP